MTKPSQHSHQAKRDEDFPLSPKPRRWIWDVCLAVGVVGGLGLLIFFGMRPEPLPEGVSRADFQRAEQLYRAAHNQRPDRFDTLAFLGELSVQKKDWKTALACDQDIPSDHPRHGLTARLQEGQVLIQMDRAEQAETALKTYLELAQPASDQPRGLLTEGYNYLTYLLSVELRLDERKPFLETVHDLGLEDVYDSKMLYFPHLLIWRTPEGFQRLRQFLDDDPTNLSLRLAHGRYLSSNGQLPEARTLLEQLDQEYPSDLMVSAALLECHFEAGDEAAFAQVAKALPPAHADDPWLLNRMRAEFAVKEQRWDDAIQAYQTVLKSDPANPECHMGLARVYARLGRVKDRDEVLYRSQVIAKIRVYLSNVNEHDPSAALELAALCEKIELGQAARTFRGHAERISLARRSASNSTIPSIK